MRRPKQKGLWGKREMRKQLLGWGGPQSVRGRAVGYLGVIPNQFTVVTVQDVLNLVMTQGLGAEDAGFL